jgi:LysR family malonate utilization transcriptional regulator
MADQADLFHQIFLVTGPVFGLVIIGMVLKRLKLIDDGFISTSSNLVFRATMPTLLFISILQSDLSTAFQPDLVLFFSGATILGFGLAWLWSLRGVPFEDRGVYVQGAFRGNCGIMSLALAANQYGDYGLSVGGVLSGIVVVIHSLEEAINTTRETAGLYSNLFKLGALYSLTLTTVPKLIAGLKLRNGDLNIELMLNSNDALLKKLRGFELDAMLIALDDSFDTPEFTTLPLFEDDILLAVPRDSELAQLEAITLAKLINPTFVTLTNGFATFRDSYRVFDEAGFEPNVVMQVSDIFSLISMVGAGVGYALLPKRVERGFEDKIKLIPIEGQDTVRQKIGMVCLASRERDPRILSCIAECRAYHREHHQAR